MKKNLSLFFLFAVIIAHATDIVPNPADPGNLGSARNPFPNVYGSNFVGGGTNLTGITAAQVGADVSGAAQQATNTLASWLPSASVNLATYSYFLVPTPGGYSTNGGFVQGVTDTNRILALLAERHGFPKVH